MLMLTLSQNSDRTTTTPQGLENANNFHQKLIDLLKKDDSLLDEDGELITATIHRRVRRLDHDLVRLLLSDDEIKAEFFEEIEGHWIFNVHASPTICPAKISSPTPTPASATKSA